MPPPMLHPLVKYDATNLSAHMALRRLDRHTALGAARFRPTDDEVLPAVFATWNVLDAIMYTHSKLVRNATEAAATRRPREFVGRMHAWQTGYLREVQLRRMVELVRQPHVQHCACAARRAPIAHARAPARPRACRTARAA